MKADNSKQSTAMWRGDNHESVPKVFSAQAQYKESPP